MNNLMHLFIIKKHHFTHYTINLQVLLEINYAPFFM